MVSQYLFSRWTFNPWIHNISSLARHIFLTPTTPLTLQPSSSELEMVNLGLHILFPSAYLDSEDAKLGMSNRQVQGLSLIRRARMYAEYNHFEVPPLGLFKQVLACSTHYMSYSRLDALRQSHIHFLVLSGEQDNLMSYKYSHVLAECLGADLKVWEDAGHGLNDQHVEEVLGLLKENVDKGSCVGEGVARQRGNRLTTPIKAGPHPLISAFCVFLVVMWWLKKRQAVARVGLAGLASLVTRKLLNLI